MLGSNSWTRECKNMYIRWKSKADHAAGGMNSDKGKEQRKGFSVSDIEDHSEV